MKNYQTIINSLIAHYEITSDTGRKKALALLSESKLSGDHVHFNYREFPLVEQSYPLMVYYEEDEWNSSTKIPCFFLPRKTDNNPMSEQ